MRVREATLDDLPYIKDLANKESHAIGFIPNTAYKAAITGKKPSENRWSDTCNDKLYVCEENEDTPSPDLVGFVLMSYGDPAKVNQICIQEDARLLERGKLLLKAGVDHGARQGIYDFSCGCADDLPSNIFWKSMGWEKLGERKGRHYTNTFKDSSDRQVNLYSLQIYSLFYDNDYYERTESGVYVPTDSPID